MNQFLIQANAKPYVEKLKFSKIKFYYILLLNKKN